MKRPKNAVTSAEEPAPNEPDQEEQFSLLAQGRSRGTGLELISFLAENKKWWLLPILAGFLLLSVIAGLTSTAVAPFIYTLF